MNEEGQTMPLFVEKYVHICACSSGPHYCAAGLAIIACKLRSPLVIIQGVGVRRTGHHCLQGYYHYVSSSKVWVFVDRGDVSGCKPSGQGGAQELPPTGERA